MIKKDRWSPYLVGSLIGILLTILMMLGRQIGASGAIARISTLLELTIHPKHTMQTTYFKNFFANDALFSWSILFIIGLFLGSLFASKLTSEKIPPKNTIWEKAHGPSKLKRHIFAFLGGSFLLFGARLAGGCTSGHAISGGAQLSVTSWIFMFSVFATAIPTAFILYRLKRSSP